MYFFEIHNFEDKRSLVEIDQLPNISFQFFIKWAQFFSFSFIKSIKIGSFPRFGYPKIRRGRDPCGEEVLHHIAAQRVPGHCIVDVIQGADWGTMIACHMKAKYIYTYAEQ